MFQDWRFEKNPLVVGSTKIRFFAAAPLLSVVEGRVVGVLSIFGKEPREAFPPQHRNEFAQFARTVVNELDEQAEAILRNKFRLTPLLDRESKVYGPYIRRDLDSPPRLNSTKDIDADLLPYGLRYHRSQLSTTRRFTKSQSIFALEVEEPTPPSTAESDYDSFADHRQKFSKSSDHLSHDPDFSSDALPGSELMTYKSTPYGNELTNVSQFLRALSPRPFSGSDLTSVCAAPRNSEVSLGDEDFTTKPVLDMSLSYHSFGSLSDANYGERLDHTQEIDSIDRVIHSYEQQGQQQDVYEHGRLDSVAEQRSVNNRQGIRHYQERAVEPSKSNLVKDSLAGSNHSSMSENQQRQVLTIDRSEAARIEAPLALARYDYFVYLPAVDTPELARVSLRPQMPPLEYLSASIDDYSKISDLCKKLNSHMRFDLICCIDVKPVRERMSQSEKLAPGGLALKNIFGYGVDPEVGYDQIDLSPETYLEVLAKSACVEASRVDHIPEHQARYQLGLFQSGYLTTLHVSSGAFSPKDSGIILGAFRKARREPIEGEKTLLAKLAFDVRDAIVRPRQFRYNHSQTTVTPGTCQPPASLERAHTTPLVPTPFPTSGNAGLPLIYPTRYAFNDSPTESPLVERSHQYPSCDLRTRAGTVIGNYASSAAVGHTFNDGRARGDTPQSYQTHPYNNPILDGSFSGRYGRTDTMNDFYSSKPTASRPFNAQRAYEEMPNNYHTASYRNAPANHSFQDQYAREETPFDRQTPAYYLHEGSYLRVRDGYAAPSHYIVRPGDQEPLQLHQVSSGAQNKKLNEPPKEVKESTKFKTMVAEVFKSIGTGGYV